MTPAPGSRPGGGAWRAAAAPAAVAAAALVARAVDLGAVPLDPLEARAALAAWTGAPAASAPLHHLALLAGRAAEAAVGADAAARWPSALAGAVAAALAILGGRRLGSAAERRGAVAAAALLAGMPWWVDAGRHAEPEALGLAVVLAAVTAWLHGRVVLAAALAGAALAAGGLGATAVAGALLPALAQWLSDRRAGRTSWWRDGLGGYRRAPAAALALLACAVAPRLAAAGGSVAGAEASGSALAWPPDAARLLDALLLLGVYAPFAAAFGAAGIALGLAARRPVGLWLAGWLTAAIALAAMSVDPRAAAGALLAPLTLAAGGAVAAAIAALRAHGASEREGAVSALSLVALGYALVRAAYFAERGPAGGVDPVDSLALAGYGLLVALVPVAAAAVLWGGRSALRVLALAGGFALAAMGCANGSALLSGRHLELARPERASPGVRLLAAEALGAGDAIILEPGVDDAAAWALVAAGIDVRAADDPAPRVRVAEAGRAGAWRTVTRWRPHFADRQAVARWYVQRRVVVPGPSGSVEAAWARVAGQSP